MKELTLRQARELLTTWAAEQSAAAARRDEVVRTAVAAGLSKSEIHRLTGIARSTVDRIVEAPEISSDGPSTAHGGGNTR
jgi:DNA invertase Pin-like site-specific DNA recombinase